MSLAEDLRRPIQAAMPSESTTRPPVRRTAALTPRLVTSPPKASPPPRLEETPAQPPTVADESFNLLDRAAKSIVFLLGRYRQLEEHVRQLDAWSKAQIQAAEAAATRWQDSSAEAERKVQELQHALASTMQRAEVAEGAVKRDRDALLALQHQVVATFGLGSEAHDALSTLDFD